MGITDGYLKDHDWLAKDHGTTTDIPWFGSISKLPECAYEKDKWDKVTVWPGGMHAPLVAIDPEGYPF